MQLLRRPLTGFKHLFRQFACCKFPHRAVPQPPSLRLFALLIAATGCGTERPIPVRNLDGQASTNPVAPAQGNSGDSNDSGRREGEKNSAEQKGSVPAAPLSPSDLLKEAGEDQALLSLAPTIESYRLSLNASVQTLWAKTELLGRVQRVNALLCSKYQEQAASCPLLYPLLAYPRDQNNTLAIPCTPYREKGDSPRIEIQVPTSLWISLNLGASKSPEKFLLKANKGTLLSNEFVSGSRTKLTWRSNAEGGSQTTFPTLADLTDLQIAPAASAKMPDWKLGTTLDIGFQSFKTVDGQSVADDSYLISSAALLPWKKNALIADITLAELGIWNTSSRCQTTEAQIDSLVTSVKPQTEATPSAAHKIEKKNFNKFAEAEAALKEFSSGLKETKSLIIGIDGELERENERGSKLRTQLRSSKVSSCHDRQPLRNIEIYLKGSHLEDSEWDRNSTEIERKSEGSPERIEINLGTKVILRNNSEESSPIFNASGFLASNDFQALSAMDVDFIRIKKLGIGFQSTLNCWTIIGWSRWGLGKKCEYRNSETNRYRMDSLLIRIDGRDFFRSESLNFSFSGDTKTWEETRLSNSEEYTNFMTNESCKGGT